MGDFAKEINASFSSNRLKALLNIKFTSNWLDQIGSEILKPFNISEQQYNILRILRGTEKEISVNQVKERMIQKSPNATRLMDKLLEKKLIVRSRCENDRRVVFVKISDKGLKLLNSIDMSEFDKYINRLSESEAVKLNELLDKMRG
ncbi:MarR family winged helix-turn-helix transcriptional regulator [Lutimonas zeaxanthinifaciens]|uniref:MarR family winged helix-turn-helix transcriptional regulator n=1 Tax=Lutimonas zeaxanthinifaciens TaxID=3060215 RepID=UPI00265CEC4E|nr:MarR family transcriptional regulator [Lutimonas sp. YSD2104]WKK64824.1 MarR family transcriptional regulator [Lutimonas sp. YSD2104]